MPDDPRASRPEPHPRERPPAGERDPGARRDDVLAVLDAAGVGTWEWNLRTDRMLLSPAQAGLFGLPADGQAVALDDLVARIHPDDRDRVAARRAAARTDLRPFEMEYRIVLPDGRTRWLQVIGRALSGDGGGPRMVGVSRDITEKVELRLRVAAREAQLRAMFESAPLGIKRTDAGAIFREVNRAFCQITGYAREELIGRPMMEIVHPDDVDAQLANLRAIAGGGPPSTVVVRYIRKDRTPIWLEVTDVRAPAQPGEPDGDVLCFIRDISERKATEEHRDQLLQELEEAVRMRDDFLSIAAHELKNPLTAIALRANVGARIVARSGALEGPAAKLADALEVIRRQAERLGKLIESLLDQSRIRAGRLDLELAEVDLAQVAREVLDRFQDELGQASCPLAFDAPAAVVGRWDRMRLEQVVTNLVSNAIKYGCSGPEAQVTVRVERAGESGRLIVRDCGPGISAEARARIFERFERAVGRGSHGGFGLGLWITRQIVEALGGRISVESEPGQGATFIVELPVGGPPGR